MPTWSNAPAQARSNANSFRFAPLRSAAPHAIIREITERMLHYRPTGRELSANRLAWPERAAELAPSRVLMCLSVTSAGAVCTSAQMPRRLDMCITARGSSEAGLHGSYSDFALRKSMPHQRDIHANPLQMFAHRGDFRPSQRDPRQH